MSDKAFDRQTSESLSIPERRVVIKDPSELPSSFCSTPGGTIFSTTPGGTRIIYDRKFLLQMRNSPYTKTPPSKLAIIPDILTEDVPVSPPVKVNSPEPAVQAKHKDDHHSDHAMFSMED